MKHPTASNHFTLQLQFTRETSNDVCIVLIETPRANVYLENYYLNDKKSREQSGTKWFQDSTDEVLIAFMSDISE